MESETVRPAQPDLKKNYIYRLSYELICFGVPLITTPYLSRVLGPEGVGTYSFSYSIIAWLIFVVLLGNAAYGTREIAMRRDDPGEYSRVFWEIELTTVLSGLCCLILWTVVIIFVPLYRIYFLALTPYLIGEMLNIAWFYMGLEKMGVIVGTCGLVKLLGAVFIFLFIKDSGDVALYCFISAMTVMTANLSLWFILPKYLTVIHIDRGNIPGHFRNTLIYFVPAIATAAYTILDKTLIGIITRDHMQNGYYEQASRIIVVAKGFSFVVLNSVVSARMSYLFANDGSDRIRDGIRRSVDVMMFLGLGSVFGLIGVSYRLVPVFFGADYAPSEQLIYFMLPLILIMGISNCLDQLYYIPVGKRQESVRYVIGGTLVNLVLNICLIPLWGARGAAIATVLSESFIAVLFLINCNGFLRLMDIWTCAYKRIIAGLIMAVAVRILGVLPINEIVLLILQIVSGALIYISVLYALGDSFLRKIFLRRAI